MHTRIPVFLENLRKSETHQRQLLLVLTALVCLAHVVGIVMTSGLNGRMIQGDAASYFAYLPSIVLDRDLDLRNQFETLRVERGDPQRPFGGTDTRAANPFPIGPAVLWFPGYLIGLAFDGMLAALGVSTRPVGYGTGAALGTAAWCILLAGLGADVTRRLVREALGAEYALASAVMIWLGTPAIYYTLIAPLYSHAIAWCAVSLMTWFAWVASRRAPAWHSWAVVGLFSGLVLAIRLQDAPLLLIPVALLVASARADPRGQNNLRSYVAWTFGTVVGLLPQVLAGLWLNGSLLPVSNAALSIPSVTNVLDVLLSTGYQGWISWTPIVLPSLLGLIILTRRTDRWQVRVVAVAGLAAIVVMVAIDVLHPFGAGAAYGGRRYVSAAPVLTLGVGAILALPVGRFVSRWKLGLPMLMFWNLWLLVSYEWLTVFHGVYPTLREAVRYAVGLGAP